MNVDPTGRYSNTIGALAAVGIASQVMGADIEVGVSAAEAAKQQNIVTYGFRFAQVALTAAAILGTAFVGVAAVVNQADEIFGYIRRLQRAYQTGLAFVMRSIPKHLRQFGALRQLAKKVQLVTGNTRTISGQAVVLAEVTENGVRRIVAVPNAKGRFTRKQQDLLLQNGIKNADIIRPTAAEARLGLHAEELLEKRFPNIRAERWGISFGSKQLPGPCNKPGHTCRSVIEKLGGVIET